MQVRPLVRVALWSLAAGVLLAVAAAGGAGGLAWGRAHAGVLVAGFLLPAVFALHLHALSVRTGRLADPDPVRRSAVAAAVGTFLLAVGSGQILAALGWRGDPFLEAAGWGTLTVAAVMQVKALSSCAPQESMVDVDADPLTKGDDASYKHIKMAHRLLPLGLLLLAAGAVCTSFSETWGTRLAGAGTHVALVGYALLSMYGVGHLLIPRFSQVPAIAAGAIKGELHTSLLGIVLLAASFLVGTHSGLGRGLLVGGGSFVFLGMFVYMGVLGANIMRNKSRTQRVTPEFVYIPWTFAGVFWLISGILMGLFLNAVPDVLAARAGGLRFFHVHTVLFGGVTFLLLGWAHRLLPAQAGAPPPPFARSRGPFLLLNVAFGTALVAALAGSMPWLAGAAVATAVGLGTVIYRLRPYWTP